ncbi:hypothetical protein AMAG_15210 [Allomyces macrogynus ATCC 38327]|uniref:Trafficking protein particle complex subunit n=1 Tax=Allomyces macrogynus (strain ATCC 38327) TaxID=578462 RepID=A0A0L0T890_ALLM3|nr:hypothetical protein AMAG_15210 [Allomyces macrogynus ATCC 38327]|eukprot:KNE70945.1 hypothetical protein AMAG_15210 [Allomyces macrogynus ATCC 38327]
MILGVWIINKAGGLVFQRDFTTGSNAEPALAKLSTNDYLVLAGTFHGVHAITSRISPMAGSTGIEVLETDTFTATCHQTPTGIKIVLFTDPNQANTEALVRHVYNLYADYVMKNPFYTPEMPVRCELFDVHLFKLVQTVNPAATQA